MLRRTVAYSSLRRYTCKLSAAQPIPSTFITSTGICVAPSPPLCCSSSLTAPKRWLSTTTSSPSATCALGTTCSTSTASSGSNSMCSSSSKPSAAPSHSHHPLYEGLPRYPALSVMGGLRGLDYMGTCAFAVSGSLCAATFGLNALGCTTVGAITALGGGTVRDVIFGRGGGAFWIEEWEYVAMAVACAAVTFAVCYHYEPTTSTMAAYDTAMFWADTIGLGAFAVIGTMFGCRLKLNPLLTLVATVITCTGGGVIRDVLVRRPVRVLNNYAEAYAETTLCGGAAYLGMRAVGIPLPARVVASVAVVTVLRCLAASYSLSLPQAAALRRSWAAEHTL